MPNTPTWMRGPELRAKLARVEIDAFADLARYAVEVAILPEDERRGLVAAPFHLAILARAGGLFHARLHYEGERRRLERDEPEPRGLIVPLFADDHGKVAQLRRVLEARAEGFAENITIH